jgi:hypothetical protein
MNSSDKRAIVSAYRSRRLSKKRQRKSQDKDKKKRGQIIASDEAKKTNVDLNPDWIKNMRIVHDSTYTWESYSPVRGFKLVSNLMRSFNGYQYAVGNEYEHPTWDIKLCRSGFHFSLDPLQCIRYAQELNLAQPWRLLWVEASRDILCGDDKLCCKKMEVISEITDEQKNNYLTGILIKENEIFCYKNGQINDPHEGVGACYTRSVDGSFEVRSCQNGSMSETVKTISDEQWPPKPFDNI